MKLRSVNSVAPIVIGLVAIVAGACGSGDEPAAAPEIGVTATAIIVNTPESSGATTTDTPVPGSTDGTFVGGEGSEATFTVNEKLSSLPLPNDAVMRTGGITGEIDLSAGIASLVIDLHTLRSDSTRRDRYIRNQLFPSQANATIAVNKFPDIPEEFADGESFTATVMATVDSKRERHRCRD